MGEEIKFVRVTAKTDIVGRVSYWLDGKRVVFKDQRPVTVRWQDQTVEACTLRVKAKKIHCELTTDKAYVMAKHHDTLFWASIEAVDVDAGALA